jgi:hypothetical protein
MEREMTDNVLYHGTSALYLESLRTRGILPRRFNKGAKDNWKHTVPSNRNAVYLTNAYAWHFAAHASDDKKGLILEIDRSLLLMPICPDEDWMEQVTRKQDPTPDSPHLASTSWTMKQRTLHYRKIAVANPQLGDLSLAQLGTAAHYGAIPWLAVSRYVIIDYKAAEWVHMNSIDSLVSVLNYRILEARHRAFTAFLFGDDVTPEEVLGITALDQWEGVPEEITKHLERERYRVTIMKEIMLKRDGLTVVDLRDQRTPGYQRLTRSTGYEQLIVDTRRQQDAAMNRVREERK